MTEEKENHLPQRRKRGLVVQNLPDEVLVYDLERHKAHCLNQTAAMIWKRCDGKTSVKEIARTMKFESVESIDEEIIWEAVKQLESNHLLNDRIARPTSEPDMSRRDLIKKVGITASILLPAVTSIIAPTAAQAQSCSSVQGDKCGPGFPPCCPGLTCVRISANLCQCSSVPGIPCS